jgi:uncharacterized protein YcbK (DUF882 family)
MRTQAIISSLAFATAGVLGICGESSAARPMSYVEMVRMWHVAPSLSTRPLNADGRPALVLEMINTSERIEMFPERDDGGFSTVDLERASQALRDTKSGEVHAFDARILDLAYQIERHFEAPVLRIISAYRTPHRRHSNHSRGRALDMVVPGVKDGEVAKFARTLGFVGVGVYPRSGFVHVDSRPKSYFWVDASGPGRRGRVVPILAKLAAASDASAIDRGQAPPDEDPGKPRESETAAGTTLTASAPRTDTAAVDDSR